MQFPPGLSIGIFPGTFDPVHRGHLALARAALRHLPLDRVLFLPAAQSVFKPRPPVASSLHRFAMLALAAQTDPRIGLLTTELDGPRPPRYTVDSLELVRRALKPRRMWLLMGLDNFAGFAGWRRPRRIATLARLGVAGRPGVRRPAAPAWLAGRSDFFPLNSDLSATRIRTALHRSGPGAAALLRRGLPVPVRRYLEKNPLYA